MHTNGWEKRLAAEANRGDERNTTAVSNGNRNEQARRKLTGEFIDSISGFLQASIDKFNSLSKSKIELMTISKDERGDKYCGVKYGGRQIRFVDSGRGFIRIDLIKGSSIDEAAFVLARLSRSGEFITWDEKNLMGVGNRLEPVTMQHLVRKYVTMLVTI